MSVRPPEDGEMWGKKFPGNETTPTIYTGLFGDIAHRRKDFGVANLFITPFVMEMMDMSNPYQIDRACFVVPAPKVG